MKTPGLTIRLPWPPSVNTYWRHVHSRTILSKKGREYREDVTSIIADLGLGAFEGRDRLYVYISAFPPDRRRRDLDNLPKGILDSLEHAGVFPDDEQIDRLEIQRCDIIKGGFVLVRIEVI